MYNLTITTLNKLCVSRIPRTVVGSFIFQRSLLFTEQFNNYATADIVVDQEERGKGGGGTKCK